MRAGTDSGLAAAAEKLRDLAAHHAAEADRAREPAPEVVEAIRSDGFARHFVSARRGGAEGSFGELTEAVLTLGAGCSASAWIASLSAHAARFAAHLPEEGHRAIWGESPDVLIAAGLPPTGRAERVQGGWKLSGRWGYVSGAASADWVLLCAAVRAPDGAAGGPPGLRFFALPWGTYTVLATWDSIGMRGTGSNTVVAEDVLVPEHLSFAREELLAGGNGHSPAPVHRVPLRGVAGLAFAAPVVGAAAGALSAYSGLAAEGKRRTPARDNALARASALTDSARHLVTQNARALDERLFTSEILARSERNAASAAELSTDAVTLLVRSGGTGGLSEAQPLQRFWRDVVSGASHVALQFETAAAKNYADTLLEPAAATH